MSELKAFVARKIDDGMCDPVPCVEVYLKSEADKAIAKQKDKLQNVSSLLKETREWLVESQKLHKRCADNAVKIIRHNKYKRCLAMAERYEVEYKLARYLAYNSNKEIKAYKRWQKWLELAEKFKEAK